MDRGPRPAPGEYLRLLHERVLSGSAVLTLYGADLRPNDLDVVPSFDPANLRRIADWCEQRGAGGCAPCGCGAEPHPKDVERAAQYVIVREAVHRGDQPRGTRWLDS
ncbi:hypothetical protein GCM10022267_14730 [Lentzea roselyniae]|uniref:Nucleotidyltransferase domain-containing protein n=1 Tax=Lentzea roselyniae TaxID=531940 RepID=A0ABP7AC00_9PSEU